nr:MAG TPA: hypothetical protein [Caudoviricetes sp.]
MSYCSAHFLVRLEGVGLTMSTLDFVLISAYFCAVLFFICFIDWS